MRKKPDEVYRCRHCSYMWIDRHHHIQMPTQCPMCESKQIAWTELRPRSMLMYETWHTGAMMQYEFETGDSPLYRGYDSRFLAWRYGLPLIPSDIEPDPEFDTRFVEALL